MQLQDFESEPTKKRHPVYEASMLYATAPEWSTGEVLLAATYRRLLLGVSEGEWVRLVSRRGDIRARAKLSERVYPGLVWMALHFAEARVNWLTHDVGDPLIGTPEYKVSAVRLERV